MNAEGSARDDAPVRKHFGTDGVRGVAGEVLTASLALSIGAAATREVGGERPRVLVIRDTRESGEMLESALAAGIASAGGDVLLGGVLPTPAAPLLIARYGLDLAAVISASHNPYEDNGIKFFGADSFKLSDATELAIEARMASAVRRRRRARSAASGPCTARTRTTCARCTTRFAELDLERRRRRAGLRQRRDLPRRARDLPPPRRDGDGARRRPRRAQHQRRLRLDAHRAARRGDARRRPRHRLRLRRRRRPPAGRRPRRARSSTATSCRARGAAPARAGPPARRRRRRDGHDELRLSHGDARRPASRSRRRRSATATCSRSCAPAAGASAASSPATSSTWASSRPATGSRARC